MLHDCCRVMYWAVSAPNVPIRFEEELSEYQIIGSGGELAPIKYCPFCGKTLPPSRRGSLFVAEDPNELADIGRLISIDNRVELEAIIGPPDEVIESASARQHRYSNRWKTIDLIVQTLGDGKLEYLASPKPIATNHE